MAKRTNRSRSPRSTTAQTDTRSWSTSLFWAAVVVGAAIAVSAVVNPLFDRAVHWDWMSGAAPAGFAVLTLALRRRWM